MKPNFDFEKKYWEKNEIVIGVDEVGRGAIAGPVVAAAAVLNAKNLKLNTISFESLVLSIQLLGIDDSKRFSRKKREKLEPIIKKYFYFGIGESSVKEINKFGIVRATELAMKRAIRNCKSGWDCHASLAMTLLIDGREMKGIGRQEAIIKGDQKSISIAAASIIAKVYRDKLMREMCGKYSGYGFDKHVGYGTKQHAEMLRKLGMCELHRKLFVRSLLKNC